MTKSQLFIGIDDTDIPGSPGTGRLARWLAEFLEARGAGSVQGITRHQLLIHPRIPFTSHNSAACIGLDTLEGPDIVFDSCRNFLKDNVASGSDPGLCVTTSSRISPELIGFGKRTQKSVVDIEQARRLVGIGGLLLEALGQKGQGIIGAIAAVGLRMSGNDGRFIELRGIRQVGGFVSVRDIIAGTGITSVVSNGFEGLADDCIVDTQDWLRPWLIDHGAMLVVEPHPGLPGGWIAVDRRNNRRSKS